MADTETVRELRRSQIIAAARGLVAEAGLSGLTIAKLEAQLGFTRGVITYHFTNKAEIVRAVLASAIAEIDEASRHAIAPGAPADVELRAAVSATVRGFVEHREAGGILVSFWSRIASDDASAKANAALYSTYRQRAEQMVARGQSQGTFRTNASPSALGGLVVAIVTGITAQSYFDPVDFDWRAAVDESVDALLAHLAIAE